MYQLSQSINPTNYNIVLDIPTVEPNAPIKGQVIMKLDVKEAASTIVMHSFKTTKHISARLTREGVYSCEASSLEFVDDDHFFLTISFDKEFGPGSNYELEIVFESTVQKGMAGLYASPRMNEDGTTSYYLASQCESTDARRILPCFDEPIFKATFDLTLRAPENLFAISNMPEASINPLGNGLTETVFHTSPTMSTYLLAIVAGEMEFISGTVPREGLDAKEKEAKGEILEPVLVRVFAPKGLLNQAEFALEEATACLGAMQRILNKSFPLPKCDFVPISGFAAGAMENWGLITFRERLLLCDPEITTLQEKRRITTVIAHELAHQEFGNSVTMAWWNELWLNESFATLLQNAITDMVRPEMKVWDVFYHETVLDALKFDETPSTHPINVTVQTPDEIDAIFDAISYRKGGSVLNMILKLVGHERFFKAISTYLYKRQYGTGTSLDVFEAFDREFGREYFSRTIGDIMATWIQKEGAPLISVRRSGPSKFTFSQSRIRHTPQELKKFMETAQQMESFWSIPIRIQYLNTETGNVDSEELTLLSEYSTEIASPTENHIPILHSGPYSRVSYDSSILSEINAHISSLCAIDVASIIADCTYMLKMQQIPVKDVVMFVIKAMKALPTYEVISLGLETFGFLRKSIPADTNDEIIEAAPVNEMIDALMKYSVEDVAKEKLSANAPEITNFKEGLLRSLLLNIYKGDISVYHDLVKLELMKPLVVAQGDPVKYQPRFEKINTELRGAILATVARTVSSSKSCVTATQFYLTLVAALKSPACTKIASLPAMITSIIGTIRRQEILEDILNQSLSVDWIKAQDFVFLWDPICNNKRAGGHLVAKKFLMDHWEQIIDRLDGGFLLGRVVTAVISRFLADSALSELKEFFDNLNNNPVKTATSRGFENAESIAGWSKANYSKMVTECAEICSELKVIPEISDNEAKSLAKVILTEKLQEGELLDLLK